MENVKAVEFFAPRIETSVHDVSAVAHQGRFENVAATAHLFEQGRVEMKCRVFRLIIEGHHLNSKRPEKNRIEIGRIDAHSGRIRSQQLRLSVGQNGRRLFAAEFLGRRLVDGTTFENRMTTFARQTSGRRLRR